MKQIFNDNDFRFFYKIDDDYIDDDYDATIKLSNNDNKINDDYITYDIEKFIVLHNILITTQIDFDDDDIVDYAIYAIELLQTYHRHDFIKNQLCFILSNNNDIAQLQIAKQQFDKYFNQQFVDDVDDDVMSNIDNTIESLIETNQIAINEFLKFVKS